MSLLFTAAVATIGALVGGAISRQLARRRSSVDVAQRAAAEVPEQPRARRASEHLDGFPCQLGDVVIRAGGDEAWLAGALVLSEAQPVSVLFFAPDAGGDRVLYARPQPAPLVAWLDPLGASELLVGREPASSIEVRGEHLSRTRRLPVALRRLGSGAPDVGDFAIVAEYISASGITVVVLAAASGGRAFFGHTLAEGMFDVLPGERTAQV